MLDPLRKIQTDQLDSDFLQRLRGLLGALEAHGIDVVATFGFRSLALQKILYDRFRLGAGPRAAPPGKSAHNYGLAVDLLVVRGGRLVQDGRDAAYVELADVAQRYGLKTLASIGDAGHVELENWQDRAKFLDVTGA